MFSLQKFLEIIGIISCLLFVTLSSAQAENKNNDQLSMPNMGMMNPHMTPSMMNPMMGMMNPHMMSSMMNPMMGMMNPMMGMMNPMMMGGGAMNPMMGMNMMYPMMGMMGPMMGPMSGGMAMPGMSSGSNPMSQMPGAQMMDPKQYEQWFKQWTEMMQNFSTQVPTQK